MKSRIKKPLIWGTILGLWYFIFSRFFFSGKHELYADIIGALFGMFIVTAIMFWGQRHREKKIQDRNQ